MQHKQTVTNSTVLILLRISLMLVATLAALMLTLRHTDVLPLGNICLFLVAITGSLLIGSELLGLSRKLGKTPRLPASQP